jgi:energy-coupling factor transporter ATP-binding protein EcfA2
MTFEYSGEKLLVNINLNPDYVDLYGDESSISNVTGIVGVNGSGKSSLINFLYGIFSAQNLGDSFCFVFVEIDSEIQVYQYISHNRHKLVGKWRISEDLESFEVVESIYSQPDFIFDRNSEYSSIEYITYNPILRYENQQLYDKEVGTPNLLNRSSSYLFRQALSADKLKKYLTVYDNETYDKKFYNPFGLYNFESFKRKVRLLAFINEFEKIQILQVFKDIHFPQNASFSFHTYALRSPLLPSTFFSKNEEEIRISKYVDRILAELHKIKDDTNRLILHIYFYFVLNKNIDGGRIQLEKDLSILMNLDFLNTDVEDILKTVFIDRLDSLLELLKLLSNEKLHYKRSFQIFQILKYR